MFTQALEVTFLSQFLGFDEMILHKDLSIKFGLTKQLPVSFHQKITPAYLFLFACSFFLSINSHVQITPVHRSEESKKEERTVFNA